MISGRCGQLPVEFSARPVEAIARRMPGSLCTMCRTGDRAVRSFWFRLLVAQIFPLFC